MAVTTGPCVQVDGGSLVIAAGRSLAGEVAVPGDKSISHRAIMLSMLASGKSSIAGLPSGDDVARTVSAARHLGIDIRPIGSTVDKMVGSAAAADGLAEDVAAENAAGRVDIYGGRDRIRAPGMALDMGNSGTGMRLLVGLLAGFPWSVRFVGDESLSARPMDRIAIPLGMMGATVSGIGEKCHAPLAVTGGALHGIDYTPPQPSAQVKSAILFAGLSATGTTTIREKTRTRIHTEELLNLAGTALAVHDPGQELVRQLGGKAIQGIGRELGCATAGGEDVYRVSVKASEPSPIDLDIPGDPSQAAYFLVAALMVPGSAIRVGPIYIGDTRTGFLEVLKRMGAVMTTSPLPACSLPVGYVEARYSRLRATSIEPGEVASLVDEVPVLAVAASVAEGETVFKGLGELRVKESNRLEGTARIVNAFGGSARVEGDGLVVVGVEHLRAGTIDSLGDHRVVMAGAVAALAAMPGGVSVISGYPAVRTSYPGFADDLSRVTDGWVDRQDREH